MGSIGDTAARKKQRLATYLEARKFLDRRFNLIRERGYNRRVQAGKPCQAYWWVKLCNEQWEIAARHLEKVCCKQREGSGKYDRVRTVNPGKKTKLANSTKLKKLVHESDDRRGRTGLLQKNRKRKQRNAQKGRGVGRPALSKEARLHHAKISAAKKARKRRLRNHPKRAYPQDRKRAGQPESRSLRERQKKLNQQGIAAARGQVRQHHEDTRPNHDRRYAYRKPIHRLRSRDGFHGKHRGERKAGNANAEAVLGVRAVLMAVRRKRRLRRYWSKVRRIAGK